METLLRDIRHALRGLMRSPGFTCVALLTLALGIGGNTAIFSVVNAVLLRDGGYRDPDRLVMIWESRLADPDSTAPVSPAAAADWRDGARSFQGMAFTSDGTFALTGMGEPESILGYRLAPDFLPLAGAAPALGRGFLPQEASMGAPPVVLLSDKLWRRRFEADPGVLGRIITLNGIGRTVVGVMPPGFDHPGGCELWVPLAMSEEVAASRTARVLRVVGRLAPGATLEQARAELAAIAAGLQRRHPESNAGWGVRLEPLRDAQVGDIRPALLALLGAVGFVLLIAAANIAGLLMSRAASRGREIAIRAALGAGAGRIARQLLTESVVLACLGGALGLLLAAWSSGPLLALIPRSVSNMNIPAIDAIPIDATVLGFTLAVTLAAGLAFGLAPALQAIRRDLAGPLKQAGRGAAPGRRGLRRGLVAAEIAVCVVLLAGAGLMIRSLADLRSHDLGYDTEGILSLRVQLPSARYEGPDQWRAYLDRTLERVRALPGVRSAGVVNYLPLSGWWGTAGFRIEGRPEPGPGDVPSADHRLATPGYFETMRIGLARGRLFTDRDDPRAPRVAIVNEALSRRHFPGEDPLGRRVRLGSGENAFSAEIVGVIRDIRHFGPGEPAHDEIYFPFAQSPWPLQCMVIRGDGDPSALASSVRAAIWSVDADQPIMHLRPLDALAAETLAVPRISGVLLAGFAALALLLAAVGVYGLMADAVAARAREIGVRVALGAAPGDVSRLFLRQGMVMTGIGLACGLAGAAALTRVLGSLLHGVAVLDPVSFGGAAAVLSAAALAACWIPARRATRLDPIEVLRSE
ncbi:MAG TPA: ABC transporter permease [Candidatus Polarisedimenticolia bacterium]|nr:ABC transporter permease [Candidatus Polarisedimenticolia bacterium]